MLRRFAITLIAGTLAATAATLYCYCDLAHWQALTVAELWHITITEGLRIGITTGVILAVAREVSVFPRRRS